MAHKIGDRIKETVSAGGTAAFTFTGALEGFAAFSTVLTSNGTTTWYCAVNGLEWEVGLGTRTAAGVMARTTVFDSSAAGAVVDFSAPPTVFCTVPATMLQPAPAFRGIFEAANSAWSYTAYAIVPFNTETFDTHSLVSYNGGQFLPLVPGYYQVNYQIRLTTGTAVAKHAAIFKNGAIYSHASDGGDRLVGCDIVYLNGSTDYLDIRAYAFNGGATIYGGADGSFMSVALIRRG